MMRRFHEAKVQNLGEVKIWGTGSPLREFLHSDDLASALVLLMDVYEHEDTINVGSGLEVTIAELARLMKEVTGFSGALTFDPSKPDGTPRKIMDIGRIQKLGWNPKIDLHTGLKGAYAWALQHQKFA